MTTEVKTLIAGSAVQLTFGLSKYVLSLYHTIRIYPRVYYSKIINKRLKGGTSRNGTMSFSWEDFLDGYADDHDGINLGLHEMAHALKFDVTYGDMNFDKHFQSQIEQWELNAMRAFKQLRAGNLDFFRFVARVLPQCNCHVIIKVRDLLLELF